MLSSLYIKNYALISELHVDFNTNFTTITGETGAGKSILLGGLSLVLGRRAELGVLKDKSKKSIIEAQFSIENHSLERFFDEHDLDYSPETLIRREILSQGKSRAFINDSPVTLEILKSLAEKLIDIHSQDGSSQMIDERFYLSLLDKIGNNDALLQAYKNEFLIRQQFIKSINTLKENLDQAKRDYDYNLFSLQEFQNLNLESGMLSQLEEKLEELSNVEEISERLVSVSNYLSDEHTGILYLLTEVKSNLSRLSSYGQVYANLHKSVQSLSIELDDLCQEILNIQEHLETDPHQLEEISDKLRKIFDLQKKHQVQGEESLISIERDLQEKINSTEVADNHIKEKEKHLLESEKQLDIISQSLHQNRKDAIPLLKKQLEDILSELGMPSVEFAFNLKAQVEFLSDGKESLEVLFSANKGVDFGELKKIASGGERSRIMLAIKSVLSKHKRLPSIIFDEIDTGISGEIALKTGKIMQNMSQHMQVIAITHLPQIAAKGKTQMKVYKSNSSDGITSTFLKTLNPQDRLMEIAQMLSGHEPSKSAIKNASELLGK